MAKRSIGIRKETNGTWTVDKIVFGRRVYKRTGSTDRQIAESLLIKFETETRRASLLGERRKVTFREAALRYVEENAARRSIDRDVIDIKTADRFIGLMPIDAIYNETLADLKRSLSETGAKKKSGLKARTINMVLGTVSRILSDAASRWRDANGITLLESAPKIDLLPETDRRPPYPLSWEEQSLLLSELSPQLSDVMLFLANSGAREQEACKLRWEWECKLPELGTSVFVVPASFGGRNKKSGVKNREDRLLVLNSITRAIVESRRGRHPEFVFASPKSGAAMHRVNSSGWRGARQRAADRYQGVFGKDAPAGFRTLRVHDLKHTFGRRLRAARVGQETRQVLLGHKNGSITTHYSAAEIGELIEAAEKVCVSQEDTPTLTLIRAIASHAKLTQLKSKETLSA